MIDANHIFHALMITVPIGIVVGLIAGVVRKKITPEMVERHGARWRTMKNSIYALGISLFGGLAYYCIKIIDQPGFGYVYLTMSIMNGVCLIRATRRERLIPQPVHRSGGLPRRMA